MTKELTTPIYLISVDNLVYGNYVHIDGAWRKYDSKHSGGELIFRYYDKKQNKDIIIGRKFASGAFVHARSEWAYARDTNLEEFGLLLTEEEAA